jgi:transcription factor SPN1
MQLRNNRTGKEERKRRHKTKRSVYLIDLSRSFHVLTTQRVGIQDLEMMNDEAVANLRSKMILAAERDVEDNQDGKPAVHKLRMLPQVVDLMQK